VFAVIFNACIFLRSFLFFLITVYFLDFLGNWLLSTLSILLCFCLGPTLISSPKSISTISAFWISRLLNFLFLRSFLFFFFFFLSSSSSSLSSSDLSTVSSSSSSPAIYHGPVCLAFLALDWRSNAAFCLAVNFFFVFGLESFQTSSFWPSEYQSSIFWCSMSDNNESSSLLSSGNGSPIHSFKFKPFGTLSAITCWLFGCNGINSEENNWRKEAIIASSSSSLSSLCSTNHFKKNKYALLRSCTSINEEVVNGSNNLIVASIKSLFGNPAQTTLSALWIKMHWISCGRDAIRDCNIALTNVICPWTNSLYSPTIYADASKMRQMALLCILCASEINPFSIIIFSICCTLNSLTSGTRMVTSINCEETNSALLLHIELSVVILHINWTYHAKSRTNS